MRNSCQKTKLLSGLAVCECLSFDSEISVLTATSSGRINGIALHHYIEFFDFSTLRLDAAFRFVILLSLNLVLTAA